MIEIYLSEEQTACRADVIATVEGVAGRLSHEEDHETVRTRKGLCLTFEFDSLEKAQRALDVLIAKGFHTEGPYDY